MKNISVIIPFYQKQPDPLKRAVKSVLMQKGTHDPDIIIIDDGSPLKANDILRPILRESKKNVHIIRQKNQGTAAARNKGLDSIGATTKYVAFLDSDDEWNKAHLNTAIMSLECGYDLYFCNFKKKGENKTFFEKIEPGILNNCKNLINNRISAYEFNGNIFNEIIKQNFIGSSGAVYNFQKFKKLRFIENLQLAEDKMFWIMMASKNPKTIFSIAPGFYKGRGINKYESIKWHSADNIFLSSAYISVYRNVRKIIKLTTLQKRIVDSEMRIAIKEYGVTFFHFLAHPKKINLIFLKGFLKTGWILFRYIPTVTLIIGTVIKKKLTNS